VQSDEEDEAGNIALKGAAAELDKLRTLVKNTAATKGTASSPAALPSTSEATHGMSDASAGQSSPMQGHMRWGETPGSEAKAPTKPASETFTQGLTSSFLPSHILLEDTPPRPTDRDSKATRLEVSPSGHGSESGQGQSADTPRQPPVLRGHSPAAARRLSEQRQH
jgi:hypothetical protein